jgi:histone-lysine N-methyltransferase SETMAR
VGRILEHPPYSPDLAPSDFHVFGPLKKHMCGKRFADDEEDETEARKWLRQQSKYFCAASFDVLVKRWDKCINVGGGYLETNVFSRFECPSFMFHIHL